MKRVMKMSLGLTILCIAIDAHAQNLVQAYNDALQNDQIFAQAQATWLSAKEGKNVALANVLPGVVVGAGASKINSTPTAPGASAMSNNYSASLTITQPVFNMAYWEAVSGASLTVKSAMATYSAAAQSLMQRTAEDYFQVLQDSDTLNYDEAQRQSLASYLATAQQKYKVGLIAMTDVYQAQSNYDTAIATEIGDRTTLQDDIQQLSVITGNSYDTIDGLGHQMPLLIPRPASADAWVTTAEDQNYNLKSQQYAVLAAHSFVAQQADNYLPTVNAIAQVQRQNNNTNPNGPGAYAQTGYDTAKIGLSLSDSQQIGATSAAIAQAKAQYLNASALLLYTHRTLVQQTREAYLSIVSSVSKIKADEQAIFSAEKALEATKAGYAVGTQTMTDVLSSVSTLYFDQQAYASAEYTYLNGLINLKLEAGTLSPADLEQINGWLDKPISLAKQLADITSDTNITSAMLIGATNNQPQELAMTSPNTLSDSNYTIQVFATHDVEAAQKLINTYPGTDLRVESVNGWYKVFSGHYSSHAAAMLGISALPVLLRNTHPWIVKN